MKIDLKYFSLTDNLEEVNAISWGVLSWEATQAAICNAVENKLSLKRRPLKKIDKVQYSIAGFPYALLVWAYESIPTIAGKFTTKHVEANPCMLSWTSVDNVKFDTVMSALTTVGEKQAKYFVMMPIDKELKESYVTELYLKNPTIVPQAPCKTLVTQPSTNTNSKWLEFQKEIRGEGNPTISYHVSYRHKRNFQKDDSDAMKTDSNDLRFGPQINGFLDSDIGVVADKILQQKRSRLSRLGQKRFGPLVESSSAAYAPTKMVIFYALPQGLSDEPPKENLEQFRVWIKK
ncbi:hypothetical protein TIFTF001_031541 [Ficus carica]|uniref:Uncharacterized protein n=1 Tax=Ficus carica TaxID=3494 RepID=A0AA88DV60_FICCA|nr:hypothetical protein TIFTF001_031541 [Ficus carica]